MSASSNTTSNKHRPLTDEERELIDSINKGDIEKAKSLLSLPTVYVDCFDENGMTPLQHACYKGSSILTEELIIRGADVNSNEHDMGYTALMFAGLSASLNCVQQLLRAGAKTYFTNSVGRTATQMAAFVGNHKIVSVINNFLDKEEVEYFTKPDGPKGEIRLPPEAVTPLHTLIVQVNLSPVKICLLVESQNALLDNLEKVVRVLETMTQTFFQTAKGNEVMSIKLHLICVILRRAWRNRSQLQNPEGLRAFIKLLLAGIPPIGIAEGIDRLLRSSLKEYPYIQSQLLHQIVRDLSRHKVGELPTALDVITSHLNGQQFFPDNDSSFCATCNQFNAKNRCSACSAVTYCDQTCQKLHWFTHKNYCAYHKEKRLQIEEENKKRKIQDELRSQKEAESNSSEKPTASGDEPSSITSEEEPSKISSEEEPSKISSEEELNKTTSGNDLQSCNDSTPDFNISKKEITCQ